MTDEEAVKAVILNYSMMCGELYDVVKEKTNFMHHFFVSNPSIRNNPDLMDIAPTFYDFCTELKKLDTLINSIGEKK